MTFLDLNVFLAMDLIMEYDSRMQSNLHHMVWHKRLQ